MTVQDAAGIDAEGTDEGDDAVDDGKSKTTRGVRIIGYFKAVPCWLCF